MKRMNAGELCKLSGCAILTTVLVACGGGGSGSSSTGDGSGNNSSNNSGNNTGNSQASPSVAFSIETAGTKTLRFNWNAVEGAQTYKLSENVDGQSGFEVVADNIDAAATSYDYVIPLAERTNAQYILSACTNDACFDSDASGVSDAVLNAAIGYLKAESGSNGRGIVTSGTFGIAIDMSDDGKMMVVGAKGEDSDRGGVYVYRMGDNGWELHGALQPPVADAGDEFGRDVAISADGTRIIVGSPGEDSSQSSVPTMNDITNIGIAYVYWYGETGWGIAEKLKPYTAGGHSFGRSVDMTDDGMAVVVGAPQSDGYEGSVHYYEFSSGAGYQHRHTITDSLAQAGDRFGMSVAISGDGSTLAVGEPFDGNYNTGVGASKTPKNSPPVLASISSGAVFVYGYDESAKRFNEQSYIKAETVGEYHYFGWSVDLSGEGNLLAVGAYGDNIMKTGISDPTNVTVTAGTVGAVYTYRRTASTWSYENYIKASNASGDYAFGNKVKLSDDGSHLLVGSSREDGGDGGLRADQTSTSEDRAGAAYLFMHDGTEWSQEAYIKSPNIESGDVFGGSLAMSANAETVAIGAYHENGNGTEPDNNDAVDSGAVYLY